MAAFVSAAEAAAQVRDQATVVLSGNTYRLVAESVLTAIEVALIPDFGLGTTFWIVAILIPSLEFLGYLSRRESRQQPAK